MLALVWCLLVLQLSMLVQLLLGVLSINSDQLERLLALVPEVESRRGDISTSFANKKKEPTASL